jgi:hypothetical protein
MKSPETNGKTRRELKRIPFKKKQEKPMDNGLYFFLTENETKKEESEKCRIIA